MAPFTQFASITAAASPGRAGGDFCKNFSRALCATFEKKPPVGTRLRTAEAMRG